VTTKTQNQNISKLRNSVHQNCFVCSQSNHRGLQLDFHYDENDKCVFSEFQLDGWSQGYKGIPHGGIISAIFDGAMGNCLFAQDVTAVTAELKIRFKQALELEKKAIIKAWVKNSSNTLYILEAEIVQDGQIKASATGKFVSKPDPADRQDT
jgi:acyl-coenzyme A thioesterase PaaI-like protein